MNIIIGFGQNETDFEEQEFSFVRDFIRQEVKDDDFWFSEELIERLNKALGERETHYKEKDKLYKTASEYPDRYSYYSFNILHDNADLVVIFNFFHTNRRHALSPDGWALMMGKKPFYVSRWDYVR